VSARGPDTARTPDEELLELPGARTTDATRIARMAGELATGFATLSSLDRAVSVFGSARTGEGTPEWEQARELGRRLGEAGFAVVTGGGGGAMGAANHGAREAGAVSVGLTIDLPFEHADGRDLDVPLHFHYFFTRKVMFVRYSQGFVVLPGGFGTLDELFELVTLMQTGKIRHSPVVLVDSGYWAPLIAWLRDTVAAEGMIGPNDLDLMRVCDDLGEVVEIVQRSAARTER
jgi:uncharacterized protein (TIGR00730 family)